MSIFASDSFTGTNWQLLTAHTPEVGGPIVNHPTNGGNFYVYGNRAICRSAPTYKGINYYSGTPSSADYTVEADMRIFTSVGDGGVAGRINPAAGTFYYLYIKGLGELVLAKMIGGGPTTLDTFVSGGFFLAGTTYRIKLEMIGTAIKGYVDGVEKVSVTDSAITAAGKAGIRGVTLSDTTTGKHLDNFVATDTSTPPSPRSYAVGMIGL